MSLPITQMFVPTSKYPIKSPNAMKPEWITIHNTANDASAMSEISYMIGNNLQTSFHFAVDDYRAVQGIPLNRMGWHAGDGLGPGNMTTIGIEICYSLSGGDRYLKAENNGALLTAMLLKDFGWGIEKVRKHQDWSGKYCPHRILSHTGWFVFLNKVKVQLDLLNGEASVPTEPHKEGVKELDNAQKFMVDNKIMSNQDWDKSPTRGQVAWWLFTMYQRGLLGSQTLTLQPAPTMKSINVIAKEVIDGLWGYGQDRINRLTQAGYDYSAVQQAVNSLLR